MAKKKAEATLPLYRDYHNCDPNTGGKPLCALPTITSHYNTTYCKSPQTWGCSLEELISGKRGDPLKPRTYSTFIVNDYVNNEADRAGMPIWGDSRKVLVTALQFAGFDPKTTYITNQGKCLGPKRKPSGGEYKACRRHFEYELHKYHPSTVVLLGAEGLKLFGLDGKGGINSLHGTIFSMTYPKWEEPNPEALWEFTVIPTFNPKQYLVNQDLRVKKHLQNDLNRASQAVNGLPPENTFYRAEHEVVLTEERLDEVIKTITEHGIFAFDTESPDLNFIDSPCIMVQMSCGPGLTWVVPFFQHDPEGHLSGRWKLKAVWDLEARQRVNLKLAEVFENPNVIKCGHHLKYDINILRRWCGIRTKGWLWDSQVMHHLLDVRPPHGLKELADYEFLCGNYEEAVHLIVGHGKDKNVSYDHIPDLIFWQYGATDAELSYRLVEAYLSRITAKANLMRVYTDECYPAIYTLAEMEYNGNHLNLTNVARIQKAFEEEIADLTIKCRGLTQPDFNPGSPEQVAEHLNRMGYGHIVFDKEAAGGYDTSKDTLLEIDENECPFAHYIIRYRNRQKFLKTYVVKAQADMHSDGRVRYSYNQARVLTARLSCTFLHQIPKTDDDKPIDGDLYMRDMIDEVDDFDIFYFDYSQIELRVFAQLTGEQALLQILLDNGDVHRFTAAGALQVEPHEVSDYNRSAVGKPLNFGVIYGSEGHALAKIEYEDPRTGQKRKIGKENALIFVQNFREKYTKINDFLEYVPDMARARGNKVLTALGREIIVPDLGHKDEWIRKAAERTATNAAVQSPAAGITVRTLNAIRQVLYDCGIGPNLVRLSLTVHDSIAAGVHVSMHDWFQEMAKVVAERPIPELGNMCFPIKYGWGKTWAKAELAA